MSDARENSHHHAAPDEVSERVASILAHAEQIFASKGYDGASMRDIAIACGISKSLLYHHFQSKDEIYIRVALTAMRDLYSFVEERIPEESLPSMKIKAFMTATAEYFQKHRWAWIASTNAFWSDPDRGSQKERMERRDRYEGRLRGLIQEAVDAKEIRDLNVAMAGRLILSSLNWMHRWYDPAKALTPPEIAEHFYDMILNGLARRGSDS